ncbi:hypothetical protein ALQ95_01079 [Pseudomonas syringae pv. ribicola]|uniref:Uncharacterized protein n=1 Tax=Pseudomonas syringae pv. ribicola TaxID=55398 RepID=A0A3M2VPD5_PSESI|nr:hypothetical protein ALQ95_01079 [Pseudomonas syringae pv. ribicola]
MMFEELENYRETAPEGLEIVDVEFIWWTVAACFTRVALRDLLAPVIAERQDWSCFRFSPIADLKGDGRYPCAVIDLLRDMLPPGVLYGVEPDALEGAEEPCEVVGSFIIQDEIWHELTWTALRLAPIELLPGHLRDARFSGDLGL